MWRISKNIIDKDDEVCKKFVSYDYDNDKKSTLTEKFRLLDDDGEIYFYGYSDDSDSEDGFRPLDEIGESYGCTEIQYKNKETGKYETL